MTPVFAEATSGDVPALEALINAAYRSPGAVPGWTDERQLLDGPRTDPTMLQDALVKTRILVARPAPQGAIVGCVQIGSAPDGAWYLSSIAVHPEHQAAGLGAALLGEVEDQARRAGVPCLRMTVIRQRENLIAWYERRGFRRTGGMLPFPYDDPSVGRPLRDDLALLILEKPLDPAAPIDVAGARDHRT